MKRRSYLAMVTGTGVTVSVSNRVTQMKSTEKGKDSVELTDVSTEYRTEFPISFDATIENGEYTEKDPALITVSVTSRDSEGFRLISGNQVPISVPAYSDSESPGVVLVKPTNEGSNDDWVLSPNDSEATANLNVSTRIVSEENPIYQNLELWGDANFVDEITQGSYSFSRSVGITRPTEKIAGRKETIPSQNYTINCEIEYVG